ncbi:MAG: hydroxymethylglutaryl-CoA synthase [Flavobacterium sp. BFFFF2]|nr:MAG: hydroxymethylglutaryl-CoA synthase [Flavobacterium sp. BFFFF2]
MATPLVGIHAFGYALPHLILPIETLALHRGIDVKKLQNGLGLRSISLPDGYQDAVTFATEAVARLVEEQKVDLSLIDRIYVGTESQVDSAKPIGSFVVGLIENQFGADCLQHCDVVDLNFACIGAVDALENCLDYVRLHPDKMAIVLATDVARYDLESGGEYTQGAGAIALLIKSNPDLIAFGSKRGVSIAHEFDFFKPRRPLPAALLSEELQRTYPEKEWLVFRDQPVFDGHYSQTCYKNRMVAAYKHFCSQKPADFTDWRTWDGIIMHLPYAYQARRTFFELIWEEQFAETYTDAALAAQAKKEFIASEAYQSVVARCIAPTELGSSIWGNLYTGSLFLGLISYFNEYAETSQDCAGQKLGFLAYGSGSKAKVFQGIVQPNWHNKVTTRRLKSVEQLLQKLDFETYLALYRGDAKKVSNPPKGSWALTDIETKNPVQLWARRYKMIE